MIRSIQNTKTFNWGGYHEFMIDNSAIKIFNFNHGVQKSNFFLDEGTYELCISLKKECFENVFESYQGVFKLSGTEEQNIFLEKHQRTKKHLRRYSIKGKGTYLSIPKDFLETMALRDKKVFIYLLKI